MIWLDLAITSLPYVQMAERRTADENGIRSSINESWRGILIAIANGARGGGGIMSWTVGTGKIHNIGRQADETFPGLVSEPGAKLLHVGTSRRDHSEILEYQDDFVDVSVIATRYANYQGPLLENDGRLLTDTWTVNFRDAMIAPKKGIALSPDLMGRIKSSIDAALLSNPLWPSNYGRPDLPARSVNFVSIN
jgi:hypothetical protein